MIYDSDEGDSPEQLTHSELKNPPLCGFFVANNMTLHIIILNNLQLKKIIFGKPVLCTRYYVLLLFLTYTIYPLHTLSLALPPRLLM